MIEGNYNQGAMFIGGNSNVSNPTINNYYVDGNKSQSYFKTIVLFTKKKLVL